MFHTQRLNDCKNCVVLIIFVCVRYDPIVWIHGVPLLCLYLFIFYMSNVLSYEDIEIFLFVFFYEIFPKVGIVRNCY